MKTFLIALVIGLMCSASFAQTTQVKIGRHGACNSGRGICGIQYQPSAKSTTNNAVIIKDTNGNVILRLYKNTFSQPQIEMLFGKPILNNSNTEILQIDQGFNLDLVTKSAIHSLTGSTLDKVSKGSFETLINDDYIDIILVKSKT